MAGWNKMPLGMQEGLGPGDFVLDGDLAPPAPKCGQPIFGPCLFCPNGWMDQNGTWHGGGLRSRPQCARWGPKGGRCPNFWPISIVAKQLVDQDATWYRGRPRPRPYCVRWGTSLNQVPQKGAQPPIFRPCLSWPRLYANLMRR